MSPIRYICGRVELHHRARETINLVCFVSATSVLEVSIFWFCGTLHPRELMLELFNFTQVILVGFYANITIFIFLLVRSKIFIQIGVLILSGFDKVTDSIVGYMNSSS